MRSFGLAKATTLAPVSKKVQSAAARIGAAPIDEPAVAPY